MIDDYIFIAALVAGLLGGVHCAGMCGGIVTALSVNVNIDLISTKNNATKFSYILFYNLARILSYSIAGLFAGGTGWLLVNTIYVEFAQIILQIIAAVFMILLGLYISNILKLLTLVERIGLYLWHYIEPLGTRFIPITRRRDAFVLGLLWGWLPCGLVYSMLLWSMSAGSALQGALLMLFFGIGTLPNLILLGVFSQQLTKYFQRVLVRSIAGMIIITFGIVMIYSAIINLI